MRDGGSAAQCRRSEGGEENAIVTNGGVAA